MASGLQCPECGHVHPAGLPEIARGDETFRCYGCYRMLSVPEGWTGRPTQRQPAPGLSPTEDAPPGAGTRDARSARLAGRGRARGSALTGPSTGAPPADLPTQMVPPTAPSGSAARAATATGAGRRTPVGWVQPRRAGRPVLPTGIRIPVWAAAFGVGLVITIFVLRKVGILSVDAIIDLYAGTGLGRFGILLVLLPMWAALSATIAHFSLEALAKRRNRSQPASARPPATTPTR
ncbi:MAG: hypothetical protein ACRDYF_11560 [Acidimicrobiia bacterium]